ncbi:hypothetical protein FEM08_05220 [Flavobacterium gilvum]|nr:hypothetical protein FEM08_05220 [Flavobacterium gilvum]
MFNRLNPVEVICDNTQNVFKNVYRPVGIKVFKIYCLVVGFF